MKTFIVIILFIALAVPLALAQEVDPEWVFRWYYSTDESDQGDAIVVGPDGYIYVAGHTDTSSVHDDWATVKITPDGDTVWTRIFDSTDDGIDVPEFIGLSSAGDVFVAGDVGMSSADWGMDALVLKYNPDGDLVASFQYNGAISEDDRVEGFGIDAQDNIFVVGYTETPGGKDYLIIKYNTDLDTVWTRTLPTGNGTFDRLYDICFDQASNIYVTGGFDNGSNDDISIIKYNQAGDTLWTRYYSTNADELPYGIGTDNEGNVYVGGYTYNTTKDFLAIKYDSAGDFLWDISVNGDGNDIDNPKDACVDANGNVYILGETTRAGQRDILLTKVDSTGALAWNFQYDDGGYDDEIVFSHKALINVDNEGSVYFGGATYHVTVGATLTNTLTFKLDSNGEIVWYNHYGGPGLDFDQIRSVTIDQFHNCYVTGYSNGQFGNWDMFVLKFTGDAIGIEDNPAILPLSTVLYPAYPNPFNGSTTISFRLDRLDDIRLAVYDILGREIVLLADGPMPAGTHTLNFDASGLASGIYFYTLTSTDYNESSRMVLIK